MSRPADRIAAVLHAHVRDPLVLAAALQDLDHLIRLALTDLELSEVAAELAARDHHRDGLVAPSTWPPEEPTPIPGPPPLDGDDP